MRPDTRGKHFGDRLVAAMQLRGNYKATALACALNVDEATISRWKRGGPITLSHAVNLCNALDVSMDWLFRGIGHPVAQHRPDVGNHPPEITKRTADEICVLLHTIERLIYRGLARDARVSLPAQVLVENSLGDLVNAYFGTD